MSLANLINESKGNTEPDAELVGATPVSSTLEGQVDAEGEIQLDVRDLNALGARLKEIRVATRALKKEEDRLKKLINSHPKAKVGYSNASISITSSPTIDTDNPLLLAALMKTKTLNRALNMSLSVPKIREIAETEKLVAEAVTFAQGRKIKTT
jgi:hypothetical protein